MEDVKDGEEEDDDEDDEDVEGNVLSLSFHFPSGLIYFG